MFHEVDGQVVSLHDADESWWGGDPYTLRPPTRSALEVLGRPPDIDDAKTLIRFLAGYPSFEPPLVDTVRDELLLALASASQGDTLPFEIALAIEQLGPQAVSLLVARIPEQWFEREQLRGIEILLSYLLDDVTSRAVVVTALAAWPARATLDVLKSFLAPQLGPDERARARLPGEAG